MKIKIFELERIQSLYENTVDYNLTESGFHPLSLSEILNQDQLEQMNAMSLGYGQTNGSIPLRKRIAAMYPDTNSENILVTNGSAEANFIACHSLLKEGDEVIMMIPNYMQIWGIAEEMGCTMKSFSLMEQDGWRPNLDELRSKVTSKTRMIALCNPDNPTGYTLTNHEMEQIVEIAQSVDAWVYCDEVYRGAELNGKTIPSFVGMYDKVMVNGGLSKAYALPGLRLGWLVGPESVIADSWAYHDYTSIAVGAISGYVAEIALQPEIRQRILSRNRAMLNNNLENVSKWLNQFNSAFTFTPPKAGGMLFVKYHFDMNSTEMAEWLRKEYSVFLLAGDVYGMDGFFRIGIGERNQYLLEGLDRVKTALTKRFPTING